MQEYIKCVLPFPKLVPVLDDGDGIQLKGSTLGIILDQVQEASYIGNGRGWKSRFRVFGCVQSLNSSCLCDMIWEQRKDLKQSLDRENWKLKKGEIPLPHTDNI